MNNLKEKSNFDQKKKDETAKKVDQLELANQDTLNVNDLETLNNDEQQKQSIKKKEMKISFKQELNTTEASLTSKPKEGNKYHQIPIHIDKTRKIKKNGISFSSNSSSSFTSAGMDTIRESVEYNSIKNSFVKSFKKDNFFKKFDMKDLDNFHKSDSLLLGRRSLLTKYEQGINTIEEDGNLLDEIKENSGRFFGVKGFMASFFG